MTLGQRNCVSWLVAVFHPCVSLDGLGQSRPQDECSNDLQNQGTGGRTFTQCSASQEHAAVSSTIPLRLNSVAQKVVLVT